MLFALFLLAACGGVRAALDEAAPLLAFQQSVSGTSDALVSSWTNGTDPCDSQWVGVFCTEGRVTSM